MDVKCDFSALADLTRRLEQAPQVIREAKRQAFEDAAPKLKAAVDQEIGGSGRVRGWQGAYVGSKGGYAAARPRSDLSIATKGKQRGFRAGPKEYPVGYITNAINSGHRTPRDTWGYRRRAKTIAGEHFYQRAQTRAEQTAQEAAGQIVQALTEHLEG